MKTCTIPSLPNWLIYLSSLLLALYIQPTQAAYTVIDEDLLPSIATEQPTPSTHYTIPFYKEHSPITHNGRATLDALIPQMRNATAIKIIGRPDARAYSTGKIANLASNRANNIRTYLSRAGVPYEIIDIEVDNSPNPQTNGNIYPCDLYIDAAYQPMAIEIRTPRSPAPQQAPQAAQNATNDQVVNFINRAVQQGQMAIEVALKLIRQLVESDNAAQTQSAMYAPQRPAQYAPAPQQYPVVAAPQYAQPVNQLGLSAAPDTTRTPEWILSADKTLKDNIDTWATANNYTLKWSAANFYRVGHTSTLAGDLLDVIDRVAASAGVVMSVSRKTRMIYINDK